MNRFKAAFVHFLISASLAGLVICLLLFGWYPLPFFWAMGGLMLLMLIIGVDVVLGPLMTMILFNTKKSRRALAFDLSLVAIVQLSALGYGLYSGSVGRLAFEVFDGQKFQLAQAGEIAANFLHEAKFTEYQSIPWATQRVAALNIPGDDKTRSDLAFFGALGVGPHLMPQYYVPLSQQVAQVKNAALDRMQLQSKHPALVTDIDKLLASKGQAWQDIAVVPFNVRTAVYTAIVSLSNSTVLKVIAQDPS